MSHTSKQSINPLETRSFSCEVGHIELTPDSPEAWGYVLTNGKLSPQNDSFTLHLVGMKEQDLQFPAALTGSGALKLHEGVNTLEYYRLIGEMASSLRSA